MLAKHISNIGVIPFIDVEFHCVRCNGDFVLTSVSLSGIGQMFVDHRDVFRVRISLSVAVCFGGDTEYLPMGDVCLRYVGGVFIRLGDRLPRAESHGLFPEVRN